MKKVVTLQTTPKKHWRAYSHRQAFEMVSQGCIQEFFEGGKFKSQNWKMYASLLEIDF